MQRSAPKPSARPGPDEPPPLRAPFLDGADSRLLSLIDAWDQLPENIKAAVCTLAQLSAPEVAS